MKHDATAPTPGLQIMSSQKMWENKKSLYADTSLEYSMYTESRKLSTKYLWPNVYVSNLKDENC